MPKKQRRVSFSIPGEEKSDAKKPPAVRTVVHNHSFDEEVETFDGTSSDENQSASLSQSPQNSSEKRLKKPHSVKINADAKHVEQNTEHDSDVSDSDNDLESSRDDEDMASESESASSTSDSESDSESESPQNADDEKQPSNDSAPAPINTFRDMTLDPRLERAIELAGWRNPTPVQSTVIPAALHGRDVLVSAPTGSGKTAAYAIPVVQHLCKTSASNNGVRAVVLVPTRELVQQVTAVFKLLCKYMDGVHVAAVTRKMDRKAGKGKNAHQGLAFSRAADVIVGTPASVTAAAGRGDKSALANVQFVVIDEADMVLSYGYENDAKVALSKIPTTAQSMLLSATLEAEGMDSFRKVILRRPLTIKVTTDGDVHDGDPTGASHYFTLLKTHKDRYLVTYAMLRLNVISGKVLIFANHINSAFRLKLFLDQFKVKSAVLNCELPANSRMHCVEQFNAGVFDILIATDEAKRDDAKSSKQEKSRSQKGGKKRKRLERDNEFGLSRGVDFRDVAAVFNFDVPETLSNYTHRAGRTARAGKAGTVLSLVCNKKEEAAIIDMGKELGVHIGPLAFRMDQIEAFRYRVEDCLRVVTDTAVNGARLADVRREVVNSETLKDYFEDNPDDLEALQHNLSLAKRIPEHLAHIPSYLLPPALRGSVSNEPRGSKFRVKRRKGGSRKKGSSKKSSDPLKSFTASGVSGSSRQRFQAKHGIKKKTGRDPGLAPKKRRRNY